MSQQDDDSDDKPYEASSKKLEDARRKGEVPRSADLATAANYAGVLVAALVFGSMSVQSLGTTMVVLLDQAHTLGPSLLRDGGHNLAGGLLGRSALSLLPWFVIPPVFVLLCMIAQRGFTVTGAKLEPKLNRVSPLSNLKQKFGRNGLFEFAKSTTKLIVITTVLSIYLHHQLPEVLRTLEMGAHAAILEMVNMSLGFLVAVLGVALAIGAVDFLWQRAEHLRRHRMSHKELTDESKQSEGDPHVKQARRQKAYAIATNKMMADVPDADVVIVNPTHYAVALKWDRHGGRAPQCVAKGVDEVAARIRETAAEAGVPIHSDPPTARALHASVELGQEIGRDHYRAVAAAIRFAEDMRRRTKARGR